MAVGTPTFNLLLCLLPTYSERPRIIFALSLSLSTPFIQRVLTDGDDTPEELEEKRRKAIESAHSEDGGDSNGGADGDHEGKLLTGGRGGRESDGYARNFSRKFL